jgi:hypothetical protein
MAVKNLERDIHQLEYSIRQETDTPPPLVGHLSIKTAKCADLFDGAKASSR